MTNYMKFRPHRQRILQSMIADADNDQHTVRSVMDATGFSKTVCYLGLQDLVKQGFLERSGGEQKRGAWKHPLVFEICRWPETAEDVK